MLKNEKYKGDFILQKYYTPNHKRGQTKLNDGKIQSYYIEENHPAIVNRSDWERVQELMKNIRKKEILVWAALKSIRIGIHCRGC